MARRRSTQEPPRPPTLPPDQAAKLLRVQYEKGKKMVAARPLDGPTERAWCAATRDILENAFGFDSSNVRRYDSVTIPGIGGGNEQVWEQERVRDTEERLKLIEALIELLETKIGVSASSIQTQRPEPQFGNKVFLVHGHNEAVLHETARFLEQLDLDVIILREQPNKGRTIIEKFIDYADVGFAVVLLTGDDRGAVAAEPFENQKLRARQNVILELGFFLGKLGRMRVCALHQAGIEIPSDYSGVLFVPIDSGGGWRLALAKEMKSVSLPIDMNKAI
jgi:predicted nucleotide-binding protein